MQGFSTIWHVGFDLKNATPILVFEKGGELTRRGIWDAQAIGLEERFWPKRCLGRSDKEDMDPNREEKDSDSSYVWWHAYGL